MKTLFPFSLSSKMPLLIASPLARPILSSLIFSIIPLIDGADDACKKIFSKSQSVSFLLIGKKGITNLSSSSEISPWSSISRKLYLLIGSMIFFFLVVFFFFFGFFFFFFVFFNLFKKIFVLTFREGHEPRFTIHERRYL